ncbi:hypothetical protein [uncultured phage cr9_1]|uniref:Uncharacterized protein n=1 Tax=uncultured phage cr9_1 TaxID=2986400 RepID=A0AAE7V2W7_9CAUD|nr:hypothetical protein M1M54_gp71 [uncultured phage cr9_1]QWM90189.1 hypothetical protein [uncultured phage cr9_1]
MQNSSDNGMTFGFNKPNTEINKQTVNDSVQPPVEGVDIVQQPTTSKIDIEKSADREDLSENQPYTDVRSITIMLVKNTSLYRKANDKVLPKRIDYIGSCFNSSKVISANQEEVNAYFPNLVGLSPNDPSFMLRVKQYLNNIRIPVDELGKTFDISFYYYHKKDYYKFKAKEEAIEEAYQKAPRRGDIEIKAAIKAKVNALNLLESQKHKVGYPINVEDYLMYRHCLLYHSVAKDMSIINSDTSIRFYFKDDKKEADKLRKYRLEVNKAKANYVACIADSVLFEAVYIQYCVLNSLPVLTCLNRPQLDKEIDLDKFSSNEPVKFNKIVYNKDIKLMAVIEKLIARGELVRSQYSQNITTTDGELIGANTGEAIAWFKDPKNASMVAAYNHKLNLI